MKPNINQTGFSLRAAVAGTCNMNCMYCPRYSSMENYAPDSIRNFELTTEEFIAVFVKLCSTTTFSTISLTGGEPLINKDIDKIAQAIRPLTKRLELNTNGLLLREENWQKISHLFDRVKISLDTIQPELFKKITDTKGQNPLEKVLSAIKIVKNSKADLAVNCVVCKSTLPFIDELLDWATTNEIRLHLLDFYYTEERRENWQAEFIPIEDVISKLKKKYGEPELEPIFGCDFYSFHVGRATIRLKTSFSGTMRSERCKSCTHYCQEGIYGLKLSTCGWVTTCPSNYEIDGVWIKPGMTGEEVKLQLNGLIGDIYNSYHDANSFDTMLRLNNLSF